VGSGPGSLPVGAGQASMGGQVVVGEVLVVGGSAWRMPRQAVIPLR
jgi:hypothetical protein